MTGATAPCTPSPPSADSVAGARRLFLWTLAATLAYRAALAAAFPVLGDEAYLFTWAREPAWGYYDHPPLAAWLLHPVFGVGLGGSVLALRLPSVALYAVLALALVRLLRRLLPEAEAERAYLAGTLLLLVPVHVVGVLMLTDVPLVLCSFLAGACLCLAERGGAEGEPRAEPRLGWHTEEPLRLGWHFAGPPRLGWHSGVGGERGLGWYAAAGAFLGLALLAKYLAALLAAAFFAWFLAAPKTRRRTAGFALLVASAVPFVAVHLAWNAGHCWSTVAFNLYSRHAGEGKNYNVVRNLLIYAGTLVYLVGPPLLWSLGRRWRRLVGALRSPSVRPAALAFGVPMALLLVSAAFLLFGAYWVLPFLPFLFVLAPLALERRELVRGLRFLAAWTGVQAAALAVAVALPLSAWRGAGFHDSLVTMERTGEVLEAVAPLRGLDPERGTLLAAPGYSLASLLSFESGDRVAVFGDGSHYGRQDDLWTDWRESAGGDVLLVGKRPVAPEDFDPYFREVERRELEVAGATLHAALGRGLDYERYRDEVLAPVRERYYRLPAWLPTWGCPFCERYFSLEACRTEGDPNR